MDISAVKPQVDLGGSSNLAQSVVRTQPVVNAPPANSISVADDKTDQTNKKTASLKDLTQMTEAMNKFIEAIDANIRFTIHQKTNELMVQVVDQANNRVLKEFPSHEFLDTVAAIRSYIGVLLDKKI